MQERLGRTEQTVLDLLANELFHADRRISDDVNWQEVFAECRKQTVLVHGFKAADRSGLLPNELRAIWKKLAIAATYNNFQVVFSHQHLAEMMDSAGIPYVILKGCASARYYPEPLDRQMGDVDFLVDPGDLEAAGEALKKEEFQPWEEEHICHVVYRNGREHMEMHFEPAGMPYGKAGDIAREYFRDVMEQAEEAEVEGKKIMMPSAFHHGLVLLLHTAHHMLGEGVGLRHLCDWAVFAATFPEKEFREIFEKRLKRIGLWKFACILTRTAEEYLGSPAGNWADEVEADVTEAVIRDIFTGGNFGTKQEGRVYETYLISDRGKDGVGRRSMAAQFCASVNKMVCTHWPKARRYKVLLPIGWAFFGIRYLVRMLLGKRPPLHPMKIQKEAALRKDIYREFGLYDI